MLSRTGEVPNEADLKDELTGGDDKLMSAVALVIGLIGMLVLMTDVNSDQYYQGFSVK